MYDLFYGLFFDSLGHSGGGVVPLGVLFIPKWAFVRGVFVFVLQNNFIYVFVWVLFVCFILGIGPIERKYFP